MPTVLSDQLHLHASLRQFALSNHVRHEMALPNGAMVHEYTNAQGQVFAVRWAGPGKPDLRGLLGSHFGALQAANARQLPRFGRHLRRALAVDSPDLKIRNEGHMGFFWGLAWLPSVMPAGVDPSDLQ